MFNIFKKQKTDQDQPNILVKPLSSNYPKILFKNILNNFYILSYKFKDLYATNYNLGLIHLEKGNISDAIFRFKFITRFWPQSQEAYIQLAYCYYLKEKYQQALQTLETLKTRFPTSTNLTQFQAVLNQVKQKI